MFTNLGQITWVLICCRALFSSFLFLFSCIVSSSESGNISLCFDGSSSTNPFCSIWTFSWYKAVPIQVLLSKPKLNQNLSSTEFEVRLHSYSDIHHPTTTTPPGTHHVVVVVNWPGSAGQRQTVQLYSHTQVSGTLHIWASNFLILKIIGFWNFLAQNPTILCLRADSFCGNCHIMPIAPAPNVTSSWNTRLGRNC